MKISIIVPIYNVEDYCRQCFDSLLSQTLEGLEVLLVNDGTRDSSGEIAMEYAKRYPSLFRYLEKNNGGLSDARNFALPYCRGEYIAFVDSDDYVHKDMFLKMWLRAKETNSDIIECELVKFWPDGKKKHIMLPSTYSSIKEYMLNSRVCVWNKLYKTSWLKELQVLFPKGLLYEDINFFYKIVPYLHKIPTTIHESLYYYRQREGSILQSSNKRILEIHDIFSDLILYYKENKLLKDYYEVIEYKYLRTLFKSFLFRMLKMKDKKMKEECIEISWRVFNKQCPKWRLNPYLERLCFDNLYLKHISRFSLNLLSKITI